MLNQARGALPPSDGKYFYMDFKNLEADNAYGQRVAMLNIARKADKATFNKYPLFISTEETTIGLFSHICKTCTVPVKYIAEDSDGFKVIDLPG